MVLVKVVAPIVVAVAVKTHAQQVEEDVKRARMKHFIGINSSLYLVA